MKLIVGLGNPGQKYRGTRHNIGFEVIAALNAAHGQIRPNARFNSEIAAIQIGQEKVLLQTPLTFMNLSGQAVRAAIDFYKLPLSDLLVVCDDLALPPGKLRVKPGGSAGGQKGLRDIIEKVGSSEFCRLRIGIGQAPAGRDAADWVLSRFSAEESPGMQVSIARARDAAVVWVERGVDTCMNRFNAAPEASRENPEKKVSRGKDTDSVESGSFPIVKRKTKNPGEISEN
jgi:PTH1 family peptidyl-tRNA hydrolase